MEKKIRKSGNYVFDNFGDENVVFSVSKGADVLISDIEYGGNRKILVEDNAKVDYRYFCRGESNMRLDIELKGRNSQFKSDLFFLSSFSEKIEGEINVNVLSGDVNADVVLKGFSGKKGDIFLKGNVFVEEGKKEVEVNFFEEGIFLDKEGKFSLLPGIDVNARNVSVFHGAKSHSLDYSKIFYMTSKGLSVFDSKSHILNGYMNTLYFEDDRRKENFLQENIGYLLRE